MAPGRHRCGVCVSRGRAQHNHQTVLWDVFICLLFLNSSFHLNTNGKCFWSATVLRTRHLIPFPEGSRQNWVSPYRPIRSVFKANLGPYFAKALLKCILHPIPTSHHLKLHHRLGPSPPRRTFASNQAVGPAANFTRRGPGPGAHDSSESVWLTLVPQLTGLTVM